MNAFSPPRIPAQSLWVIVYAVLGVLIYSFVWFACHLVESTLYALMITGGGPTASNLGVSLIHYVFVALPGIILFGYLIWVINNSKEPRYYG